MHGSCATYTILNVYCSELETLNVVANGCFDAKVEGSIPTAPRSSYNGSCFDHGLEGNLVKFTVCKDSCPSSKEELFNMVCTKSMNGSYKLTLYRGGKIVRSLLMMR